jgi:predicted Ser/Thr protein kinase
VKPRRWHDIKQLLGEALEQPPERRRAWIAQACAGDYELGSQAEALLDAYDSDPGFLEQPAALSPDDLAALAVPAAPDPSVLAPGTVLGESQYRIIGELGRGGMGVVYVAEDLRLARRVAIKSLPESARADPTRLERFRREAWAVARISHPAVATIYAFEQMNGQPFIVSEYVRGRTLRQEIENGPLDPRRAISIAIDIARALMAAHECGVVHRDLKPENVLITGDDRVKVVDFGVARLALDDGVGLTREGAWLGTPAYMAPEQMDGSQVDARADIYSFGLLLAEMLTGRHPLRSKSGSFVPGRAPDAQGTDALPAGPPGAIVRRCLQVVPSDRYASAEELWLALQQLEKPDVRPVPGATVASARWWWEFHQAATAVVYWLMVPAAYEAWQEVVRSGADALARGAAALFFCVVAAVIVSANLRLNLWFTSRFIPVHLARVRRQMAPWIRVGDWVFVIALVVAGAGLLLLLEPPRSGRAFMLIAMGIGAAVAAWLIEPVTAGAAFEPE